MSLFVNIHLSYTQNTDSLWNVWNDETQADTIRLNALNNFCWQAHINKGSDSSYYYAKMQYDFAAKTGLKKYIGFALNTIGVSLYIKGEYTEALDYFEESKQLQIAEKNWGGVASANSNIAMIYIDQGNYSEGTNYYFNNLKIFEKLKDSFRLAQSYNNLGVIYSNQDYYDLALDYHLKSLAIKKAMSNDFEIVSSLINSGITYYNLGEMDSSMVYCLEARDLALAVNHKQGLAFACSNLANIYSDLSLQDSAIFYSQKAVTLLKEIGDEWELSNAFVSLGAIYLKGNYLDKGIKVCNEAIAISKRMGRKDVTMKVFGTLYEIYESKKQYKKALYYYTSYVTLRDSLSNEENKSNVIKLNYQYAYEKQAALDSIEYSKKQELGLLKLKEKETQIEKDRTQKYAMFSGIIILLVFGAFVYRTYRQKKKDHDLITLQHQQLAATHLEIRQSIEYSKRLQTLFLPSAELLNQHFRHYFVLFKPKDKVSGDFYWFEYDESTGTKVIAVADCTGHGVPGALVSIVCSNALNKVVKELGVLEPAEILNKTRAIVIETFTKSGKDVRDGMDITICAITEKTVKTAGANNGLWLVNQNKELIEFSANRQPVGWQEQLNPFTQHEVLVQSGETIYLLTDGFQDQFGGEKGKKFKKSRLKKFIQGIENENMSAQKRLLKEEFEQWSGDNEQVDDVCILGIRF